MHMQLFTESDGYLRSEENDHENDYERLAGTLRPRWSIGLG